MIKKFKYLIYKGIKLVIDIGNQLKEELSKQYKDTNIGFTSIVRDSKKEKEYIIKE